MIEIDGAVQTTTMSQIRCVLDTFLRPTEMDFLDTDAQSLSLRELRMNWPESMVITVLRPGTRTTKVIVLVTLVQLPVVTKERAI